MNWHVRRVVTSEDEEGRSCVFSDAPPPGTPDAGTAENAMAELWHLPGPPLRVNAGGEIPQGPWELEPLPGGIAWRMVQLPPSKEAAGGEASHDDPRYSKDRPGFHRTDSIDFIQILEGEIELELDEETLLLRAGDCAVQRGTWHAWRNRGDRPCIFGAVMLRSDPQAIGRGHSAGPGNASSPRGVGPRRVVTGFDTDGKSVFVQDAEPPVGAILEHAAGMTWIDIWQTLGPLESPASGGDASDARVQLLPVGGGVSWKHVSLPPASALAGADPAKLRSEMQRKAPGMASGGDHDPKVPGRHRSDSIDFIQILSGEITLILDAGEVDLGPGDCVVQRGTWHRWEVRGKEPCRYSAVLVSADRA